MPASVIITVRLAEHLLGAVLGALRITSLHARANPTWQVPLFPHIGGWDLEEARQSDEGPWLPWLPGQLGTRPMPFTPRRPCRSEGCSREGAAAPFAASTPYSVTPVVGPSPRQREVCSPSPWGWGEFGAPTGIIFLSRERPPHMGIWESPVLFSRWHPAHTLVPSSSVACAPSCA